MAVTDRAPAPASDVAKADENPEEKVRVIVQHGRTVVHNGKSYGPGSEVTLPASDAVLVMSTGHAKSPGAAKEGDAPVSGPKIRDDTK